MKVIGIDINSLTGEMQKISKLLERDINIALQHSRPNPVTLIRQVGVEI